MVIRALWHWNVFFSSLFLITFFSIDFIFLSSNSLKILSGGWLPLAVGSLLFFIMITWVQGRKELGQALDDKKTSFEELEERLKTDEVVTVKGTAIYLAKILHGVPNVLITNLERNHVLHEKVIVLTIVTTEEPFFDETEKQLKIRAFGDQSQFYRVKLYFGFKESQDIIRALQLAANKGLDIDLDDATFFVGSERIAFNKKISRMSKIRQNIFLFLYKNAGSAAEFFKIPIEKVVELSVRVEL
jgi:KUP system potassium uptake protein